MGRAGLRIGIARVFNQYLYGPFFSAYLESLGLPPENIVWSDVTSEKLYREGAKRGAIDPCYPSKVAVAHVHNLLYKHHRRMPLRPFLCRSSMSSAVRSSDVRARTPAHRGRNTACCAAAFRTDGDVFAAAADRVFAPTLKFPGDPAARTPDV